HFGGDEAVGYDNGVDPEHHHGSEELLPPPRHLQARGHHEPVLLRFIGEVGYGLLESNLIGNLLHPLIGDFFLGLELGDLLRRGLPILRPPPPSPPPLPSRPPRQFS